MTNPFADGTCPTSDRNCPTFDIAGPYVAGRKRSPRPFSLAAFLLAGLLCFTFAACDSSGGDDSPDWTGNWRVESVNGEALEIPFYYSLSEDEIEYTASAFGQCETASGAIESIDGNVITAEDPDDGNTVEIEMDVSGDELTMEMLDSGETIELSSVSSDPRDILDC